MTHYDNIYSKLSKSVKVFKCIEMILESHYINQYLNVISRRELLSS